MGEFKTYRVKALVRGHGQNREVTMNMAGCVDEESARQKFKRLYSVVTVHWIKPVEELKQKGGE